jgi:Protein of unknown function (DUF3485)
MVRYSPIVVAVMLIVGLTIIEINMTDRLAGTNVSAEQRAALLDKVPSTVGDWRGDDMPVDPNVKKTAGAIGAVQREYRNVRTGEKVRLWLIVGHAREVSFHTPDVCYPGQGFQARASENSVYPMVFPDQPKTDFFTNTFLRENTTGQQLERVFWTWFNPSNEASEGKVVWEAPSNPRWHFGNSRALYKMYFTAAMRDPKETAEASPCVRFAREFLPEVNKALSEVQSETPGGNANTTPIASTTGQEPKAEATNSEITRTTDTAPSEKKAAEPTSTKEGTFGVYGTNPDEKAPGATVPAATANP